MRQEEHPLNPAGDRSCWQQFEGREVRYNSKLMLRRVKLLLLHAAVRSGVTALLLDSRWRQNRLLILCYHGISVDDEHVWNQGLFLPIATFAQRLAWLERNRCEILPLGEAIERLYARTLPPRAVALTFDDGFYGTYSLAWPQLKRRGWPATIYLTTYYCEYNQPVFDPAVSYLLWKSTAPVLEWPEVLKNPVMLDATGRGTVDRVFKQYCLAKALSGQRKNELLGEMAKRLRVNLAELSSRRIMHLVNPEEVRRMAGEGADIQLHTHIHRVSWRRERFLQEIANNRSRIEAMTGARPIHFCYPGGVHFPEFREWLSEAGVLSAATCHNNICSRISGRMVLPRLVDTCQLGHHEFVGWLSGFSALLPQRPHPMSEGQILED
jgi:peptidoglycan/xylan/chitin deacetylase (PgdA/CDA1 family)